MHKNIRKRDDPNIDWNIYHAIVRGHIEVVKFLLKNYEVEIEDDDLFSYSASGTLDIWKLLIKLDIVITEELMERAKKYNDDNRVYIFMSKHLESSD